ESARALRWIARHHFGHRYRASDRSPILRRNLDLIDAPLIGNERQAHVYGGVVTVVGHGDENADLVERNRTRISDATDSLVPAVIEHGDAHPQMFGVPAS